MPRTVLIVDDNGVNRGVLRKILSERYEVLEAGDGREALEIVAQRGAGLSAILLDLVMPGMDGFAFLLELRRQYAQANIPVIVMTGEDDEDTEIRALRCGAMDFLGKPYRPQIILACRPGGPCGPGQPDRPLQPGGILRAAGAADGGAAWRPGGDRSHGYR